MIRRWLANRFPHAPFNRAVAVVYDDNGITCTRANGLSVRFLWASLERIAIRTTDKGPFDEDVFIVLTDRSSCCWIPQAVAIVLLERLQKLPGFDLEAVIEAMSSTENAEFVCWQSDW